jgi:hypothetical protein
MRFFFKCYNSLYAVIFTSSEKNELHTATHILRGNLNITGTGLKKPERNLIDTTEIVIGDDNVISASC